MRLFIAAVPRTVSERTQCRHVMPLAQEWVSSDPAPRRSGSPPRSSAGELGDRPRRDERNDHDNRVD